jgi:hypothetical protein
LPGLSAPVTTLPLSRKIIAAIRALGADSISGFSRQ